MMGSSQGPTPNPDEPWALAYGAPVLRVTTASAIWFAASSAAWAQSTGEVVTESGASPWSTKAPDCTSGAPDGVIVVCGRRVNRYRLPEELRTEGRSTTAPIRPRMALSAEDLAPCGLFQGERRCSKREAAQYGYGEGRDPVTAVVKIVNKVVED